MTRKTLAIIPARGGSKGIPRKNLRPLAGLPLIAYSILQARRSPAVSRVVVSTDDPEIARVSMAFGAEVVERPAELAVDTATSESALLHTLEELERREGYRPELVVFLQATSPLRRSNDIEKAVLQLVAEDADSLFSACPVHGFLWRRTETLSSVSYDYRQRQRRQDLGTELLENGSIYVFKPRVLLEQANRLGGRITAYEMDPLDSFQVDEPRDLALLEGLLQLRAPEILPPPDLSRVELLVLDFDGVMTDNRVLVREDGREAVLCHRGDGLGLSRLRAAGIEALVLSKETNRVVAARCAKLELPCYQGEDDKLGQLQRIASTRSLAPQRIAYVGNDLNDLECLAWVGIPIAVADAEPSIRLVATYVTIRPGGQGAVREVCDLILASRIAPGVLSLRSAQK